MRVLALLAAVVLTTSSVAQADDAKDAEARRVSDALLAALVETNGVPGMAAAYVRGGRTVWVGTAGRRDVARNLPVTPDTTFRFASVSKAITATAAMRLADRGALDLDAPIARLAADLPQRWHAITARQLAAHTSGIPHYQAIDSARTERPYASVRESLPIFSGRALLSAPGERYLYSSYGFSLLSALVEGAARRPFLDYVAHDVTHGLVIGPDSTTLRANDSLAYDIANGRMRPARARDFSYSWGGAGFRGTAPALAQFGARVLSGALLSPGALQEMLAPATTSDGAAVRERDYAVGVGWRIGRDEAGARILHHAGVTTGARSSLVLYPDSNESVAILSNAEWTAWIELSAQLLAAPFREAGGGARCPVGVARYGGAFGDTAVTGRAQFALVDGHCRGTLAATGALSVWISKLPQRGATTLPMLSLAADGGFERAVLVTPAGLVALSRSADGAYDARFAAARRLTVRFE